MPITQLQREKRRDRIGSSDMASILGLIPQRNAYDVWLEKTGKLEEKEERLSDKSPLMAGTFFEDGVLQYAEQEFGKIMRNQFRVAKNVGFPLGSNVDALVMATGEPVEAKTTGLFFFNPNEKWGYTDTDEVPDRVLIQSLVHMVCTGFDTCRVAAFIGGRGFDRFLIPMDVDVRDMMLERAFIFWNSHVLTDIPPEKMTPHIEVLARIRRQPATSRPISNELVEQWLAKKAAAKIATEAAEQVQAELINALGEAEAGVCDLGTVTYMSQNRSGIDKKKLAVEHPEILSEYTTVSTCRVTRFKKAA